MRLRFLLAFASLLFALSAHAHFTATIEGGVNCYGSLTSFFYNKDMKLATGSIATLRVDKRISDIWFIESGFEYVTHGLRTSKIDIKLPTALVPLTFVFKAGRHNGLTLGLGLYAAKYLDQKKDIIKRVQYPHVGFDACVGYITTFNVTMKLRAQVTLQNYDDIYSSTGVLNPSNIGVTLGYVFINTRRRKEMNNKIPEEKQ